MSSINVYALTFNCARERVNSDILATNLYDALSKAGTPPPDVLVLCLQEIAPIAYAFLGGSYLVPYLSPFRHAVTTAAASLDGASYLNIIARNIGMTAIMVFVLRGQTAQVQWLETAGVGVGVHEMGNKGAVAIRMGYSIGDSTLELTLVSAHLAPMEKALLRRNKDWRNIVGRLVFTPVSPTAVHRRTAQRLPQESSSDAEPLLQTSPGDDSIPPMSGLYTPTSHLFLAGDLNYRTASSKPPPDTYATWPQPTKDTTSPHHYLQLLSSDQLKREMQAGRTCHGLQEATIDFPPTYKYSNEARSAVNTDANANGNEDEKQWHWAKHRWPSWCDRVLYLDVPQWMKTKNPSAKVEAKHYNALPLMSTSDHRPVACLFKIPAEVIPEPSPEESEDDVRLVPPFDIDPTWMRRRKTARRKEVVVGVAAYLGLTWEGRGILLAVVLGALGVWVVVGILFAS